MKFRLFLFFLACIGFHVNAQELTDDEMYDPEGMMYDRFIILTDTSKTVGNEERDKASKEITEILTKYLQNTDSFDEEFHIRNLGKITSEDGLLNIFTWNYQHSGYLYKYGGVVQYRKSKGSQPVAFPLIQNQDVVPHGLTDNKRWYGCLYYRIIENEYKGAKTYTIFGWDGYNSVVARKIVDVLKITNNGVVLGKPIFYMEKGRMNRMLFQYNAQTVMMLDYEENKQRIIFDHLSPSDPKDQGVYQAYGPDSTFDGLEFKKGKWYLEKNIDLRMDKKDQKRKIKKYKPPRKQK